MDHDARIRDQFTRQAVPFSDAPSMRDEAAIALLVEAAAVRPGGRALDGGCGPGLVALAFSERVAHATGLDATPAMLDRARALQRERGRDDVGWQEGDAYRLPFPGAGFDAATSRLAFHHLGELRALLAGAGLHHPAVVLAATVPEVRP